jgi:hypothetical protein
MSTTDIELMAMGAEQLLKPLGKALRPMTFGGGM